MAYNNSNNVSYSENESKFSSDFACLYRIHSLLVDCNNYSRQALSTNEKNYYINLWYATLSALNREIMPNLSQDDLNKLDKELKALIENINKVKTIGSLIDYDKTPEGNIPFLNQQKFSNFYSYLSNIEMNLRKIATYKKLLLNSKKGIAFTMGEED